MKSIILQKYSNREVRFGWQDLPSARPKPTDTESISANDSMSALIHESLLQSAVTPDGGLVTFTQSYRDPKFYDAIERPDQEKRLKRALDITSEFRRQNLERRKNRRKPGTPYRKTAFTASARHTLLEAGSVAERWAGSPSNCAVATLTLPGSCEDAYAAIAAYSGYVCDRLFRKLRKYRDKVRWVYVWEWQRRGALHLHVLVAAQSGVEALAYAGELRSTWVGVLRDVGLQSGVDLFLHKTRNRCTASAYWQNDVQRVKKSVAAYFSKYASKEAGKESSRGFGHSRLQAHYPGRWWGCQRLLRQEIESERVFLRIEGIPEDKLVNALILVDNICNSYRPIKRYQYDFELGVTGDDKRRPLGYGERHIIYFDDEEFAAISDDFQEILQCVVHMVEGAYISFNRGAGSLLGMRKPPSLSGLTGGLSRSVHPGVEAGIIPA